MRIAIGSDHAGFEYKETLGKLLNDWGYDVVDMGPQNTDSVDYPDVAVPLCQLVVKGEADKGVLICGTGIGMSIVANKVKGVRCALCSESYSAKLTRLHNDSNVLAMGARTIGIELAADILKSFLQTDFPAEERNVRRIEKVMDIQN